MVSMNSNVSRPSFRSDRAESWWWRWACCQPVSPGWTRPLSKSVAPSATVRPVPPLAAASGACRRTGQNLGRENAGKPGYFIGAVRPGDTFDPHRLESGQSWQGLSRPLERHPRTQLIEVGRCCVAPPVQIKPVIGGKVDVKRWTAGAERSDKAASPPEKAGSWRWTERIGKPVADPSESLGDKKSGWSTRTVLPGW